MAPILGIIASQQPGHIVYGSYESIATANGTGSSGTITFSSIPATYKHLQIRFVAKATGAAASYLAITQNGASTGYYGHTLSGSVGSSAVGAGVTGVTNEIEFYNCVGNTTTGVTGSGIIDILDYADTNKNKTWRGLTGISYNGSGGMLLGSNFLASTSAITTISISSNQGSFTTDTKFALYGIKG